MQISTPELKKLLLKTLDKIQTVWKGASQFQKLVKSKYATRVVLEEMTEFLASKVKDINNQIAQYNYQHILSKGQKNTFKDEQAAEQYLGNFITN